MFPVGSKYIENDAPHRKMRHHTDWASEPMQHFPPRFADRPSPTLGDPLALPEDGPVD